MAPIANTSSIGHINSSYHTLSGPHKGSSHNRAVHWHTGKSHFLSNVWFMFAMCHYERNASVCLSIRLAAGHHMCVRGKTLNVQHACLENSINLTLSLSFFLCVSSGMDGKYPKILAPGGQRSPLSLVTWAGPDADRGERRPRERGDFLCRENKHFNSKQIFTWQQVRI